MNKNESEKIGDYVKTKFSFLGKTKGKNPIWRPGVVIHFYPHFALVKFEHCKKCFSYNEIEKISKTEYNQLLNWKAVNHELFD